MYRDFSDFKNGNHPGTNIVKDENGDLAGDCTIIWSGGVTLFPAINCTGG